MKLVKADVKYLFLIFIISGILVFDLFINVGRLASFDAPFHITNMAQYYLALKFGDFPVMWNDSVGNYGLPMGLVAHQVTSYLGALVVSFSQNPVFAYNLVMFIGVLLSNIFYYRFLRFYFAAEQSFIAIFLFTFTYYKILNIYVRGALPEVFSNMFLALILIALYQIIEKKSFKYIFLLAIFVALLALNHPMMLLIYLFVFGPYTLFLLCKNKSINLMFQVKNIKLLTAIIVSGIIGVGIAAFYLLPLMLEIKYFYYGLTANHLTPGTSLSLINFIDPSWKYFTVNEIYPRGQLIRIGIAELLAMVGGVVFIIYSLFAKKIKNLWSISAFATAIGLVVLFMTSQFATPLFIHINVLSDIQFQWRILSAFIFVPPILYAVFFTKYNNKILMLFFVLIIAVISFPQLYGKNYTNFPNSIYFFTTENVHDVMMNTIWTGKTEDYPVNRQKVGIISGNGLLTSKQIKNSSRHYTVSASTPLRMVDYTFYFPGWNVYVDGAKTAIQYQDPNYRGVITYNVPAGNHTIDVKFQDTKIRLLGKIISIISLGILALLFFFRRKLKYIYPL